MYIFNDPNILRDIADGGLFQSNLGQALFTGFTYQSMGRFY